MDKVSKFIVAIIALVIVIVVAFLVIKSNYQRDSLNTALNNAETEYLTYVDSVSGITFDYNKDWVVEKQRRNSDDWFIMAHAPVSKEYLKFVRITITPVQDLDMAVKDWWLDNYEKLNVEENKIYFQHPKTHRYQGMTYAANRAQFKETTKSGTYPLDYRVMAVHKKGKTILLVEQAEIGGMDGFEADGFIRIEKTINLIEK